MEFMDLDLDLGDDLRLRTLTVDDAALVVESTRAEKESSLWGARPTGPYSLGDAQAALASWNPAAGGQFSLGILRGRRLLGAVGLMPDSSGGFELAYWVRPEERGKGAATRAVIASTLWAHHELAVRRIWLEIEPGNEASLRVARKAGYRFEQSISQHCRDWASEDADRDSWHDCLIWVHVGEDLQVTSD
jgi:RimJ/RimL family protein N-acetyltransferase